jgi:hypothetical protein
MTNLTAPATGRVPTLRSIYSIAAALFLLLVAVFFLPYLVPVAPSVSLSYLVGYNNHAAFLLFSLGSLALAILCRKQFSHSLSIDQPLGLPSLVIALFVALTCCAYRLLPLARHQPGGEALYALNRIQMLVQGFRPYRDFEFAYGPAHLYIPVLLMRLTHGSVMHGYYAWWLLQWLVGTAMLWGAVRLLPLPFPHRRIVFWIVFAIQLPGILAEGTAYTPTRSIGSAFFVILVASFLRREKSSLLAAAILSVAAALCISSEQGLAVFAGLLVWFLLLAITRQNVLTLRDAGIFLVGAALVFFCCWRMGEFSTLLVFSQGAFSFPLLPSPTNIVILITYVAAACAAVYALFGRSFDSPVVPLFLTGFALLPASMGRCDYGHLLLAAPAWLLGVAAIDARPALRIWWSPLAIVLVVLPAIVVPLYPRRPQPLSPAQAAAAAKLTAIYSSDPALFDHHPCPVIYRTVNVAPKVFETAAKDCLDTGRYYITSNALTPQTVDAMLRDLDRRPLHPLLLRDLPLAEQLQPLDARLPDLHTYELSPWLPHPRNPPFTYQKLQTYIERNYNPSRTPVAGFRIWYPKR